MVSGFIENEKVVSDDDTFIVTASGAYQFQLTQKAGGWRPLRCVGFAFAEVQGLSWLYAASSQEPS